MNDKSIYMKSMDEEDSKTREKTKILSLSLKESMVLDDQLTVIINSSSFSGYTTHRGIAGQAGVPATCELLEKIGFAILFGLNPENNLEEALIEVSYDELMILREVSSSYINVGDDNVGCDLKKKIYLLLLEDRYQHELKEQSYRKWIKKEYQDYKVAANDLFSNNIQLVPKKKKDIKELILNVANKGKVVGLSFYKRSTGELREGVFRSGVGKSAKGNSLKHDKNNHDLITLYDMNAKGYRKIPIENIVLVKGLGKTWEITVDETGYKITEKIKA